MREGDAGATAGFRRVSWVVAASSTEQLALSRARSDRMWSLPISPPTAYVLLINIIRRVERDCWQSCGGA